MDNNNEILCGGNWRGSRYVNIIARQVGQTKDRKPLYGLYERTGGSTSLYSRQTYSSLEDAAAAGWELVAARDYD